MYVKLALTAGQILFDSYQWYLIIFYDNYLSAVDMHRAFLLINQMQSAIQMKDI